MKEIFIVTEPKSDSSSRAEAMLELARSRWELENRTATLEAEIGEQTEVARELRERIHRLDYQQRELLKNLASVVDDCDDTLQVEALRLNGGDPDDPAVQQARKWYRKIERLRQSIMDRLSGYGVSMRNPVGMPSPDLDTIHSTIETDALAPGEIVKVLRPGLLWNGTILRCSLVVVAALCEPETEETLPPLRSSVG
jgi:molecular chaperone GrpE (heat shock protein)